jgi:hypothetical protein
MSMKSPNILWRAVLKIIFTIAVILVITLAVRRSQSAPVAFSWLFPTNADLSQYYQTGLFWSPTNNPYAYNYFGLASGAATNFFSDTTNFLGNNPVWVYAQSTSIYGVVSARDPFLLDTNLFTVTITNTVTLSFLPPQQLVGSLTVYHTNYATVFITLTNF